MGHVGAAQIPETCCVSASGRQVMRSHDADRGCLTYRRAWLPERAWPLCTTRPASSIVQLGVPAGRLKSALLHRHAALPPSSIKSFSPGQGWLDGQASCGLCLCCMLACHLWAQVLRGAGQVQAAERRALEAEARARALQQQLASARRSAKAAAASAQQELDALSVRPIYPIAHMCISGLAHASRCPAHIASCDARFHAGTAHFM